MGKKIVDPGWKWAERFEYSQAVRAGNFLILSGQGPVDTEGTLVGPGDIKAQTRKTFENIRAILELAGLGLDNVVEIVSYHVDLRDLEKVQEVKAEFIRRDFPTWTAVGVTGLGYPGQLLEIKTWAFIPEGR